MIIHLECEQFMRGLSALTEQYHPGVKTMAVRWIRAQLQSRSANKLAGQRAVTADMHALANHLQCDGDELSGLTPTLIRP